MSVIECIGVGWRVLARRLDMAGVMSRWSAVEPDLAGVASLGELRRVVHRGGDPGRSDVLLGALVRLGAADGGDEQDAVLVLLHLLGPGARRLAGRLADLSPDIDALVVGELALQIRGFPWRRRSRAYAASLLLDARRALLRELRPPRVGDARVVYVDHGSLLLRLGQFRYGLLGEADRLAGLEELALLGEVLAWALDSGRVSPAEVSLLVELAREGRGGRRQVAARRGVCERTLRRHQLRTREALHAARRAYLAQQATAACAQAPDRPAGAPVCWPVSTCAA